MFFALEALLFKMSSASNVLGFSMTVKVDSDINLFVLSQFGQLFLKVKFLVNFDYIMEN